MIEKSKIETLLKINGLELTDPDDEIKSVLTGASYTDDEVDYALSLLKQKTAPNYTRIDGLHKIFRTDEALLPQEISNLLGIEIEINDELKTPAKTRRMNIKHYLSTIFTATLLAAALFCVYIFV